ncbi:hypothetical protein [Ralstonia chuxiongensis]|uniref:hypothetical protein n=1 Tax=Ralstonia chuxiongensis TaxID=2957504 RepID=UPI00292ED000|nr:hypothetical protein [Ralstonia chuxiongensis]
MKRTKRSAGTSRFLCIGKVCDGLGQLAQPVDLEQQPLVADPGELRLAWRLTDGAKVWRDAREILRGRLGQLQAAALGLPAPEIGVGARVRVAVAEPIWRVVGLGGVVVGFFMGEVFRGSGANVLPAPTNAPEVTPGGA